jgi:hypothetical protein
MSSRDLDALIEAVLKTDTIVTARQKRLAWERLEQRAAHQTIWPPLVEPERSLADRLRWAWSRVRRGLAILLIDEGSYERARKERLTCYVCSDAGNTISHLLFEYAPNTRPQV